VFPPTPADGETIKAGGGAEGHEQQEHVDPPELRRLHVPDGDKEPPSSLSRELRRLLLALLPADDMEPWWSRSNPGNAASTWSSASISSSIALKESTIWRGRRALSLPPPPTSTSSRASSSLSFFRPHFRVEEGNLRRIT